jgi:hypothetical protein
MYSCWQAENEKNSDIYAVLLTLPENNTPYPVPF